MDLLFALKAAILGIVEGLTEFLPVSSTGHLIIFDNLLKFSDNQAFSNMFIMVIQLGAILAVLVLYRKKIWDPFLKTDKTRQARRFLHCELQSSSETVALVTTLRAET